MEISVIIPVYNKEAYLSKCVEGLLQQDFDSFEILLVDDGSTDRSPQLCDELTAKNERVRAFHQKNGGVTAARRYGVEQAQGQYIMLVDADDEVMPGALKALHGAMQESEADEVIGTYETQYGEHCGTGREGFYEAESLVEDLLRLRNSFCVLWGILFRKERLLPCLDTPRDIIEREDSLMQVKFLSRQPKVFFIKEKVYRYYLGIPNGRRISLPMIQHYDSILQQTLSGMGEGMQQLFVLHQLKLYENFLEKGQYEVYHQYYASLRPKITSAIPFIHRLVFWLPPFWGACLVRLYRRMH